MQTSRDSVDCVPCGGWSSLRVGGFDRWMAQSSLANSPSSACTTKLAWESCRARRARQSQTAGSGLRLDSCKRIGAIDELTHLTRLTMLKLANCGDIASLVPMAALHELEEFAWESTRVVDGDLSVLVTLPRLRQTALASRRNYRPTTAEVKSALAGRLTPAADRRELAASRRTRSGGPVEGSRRRRKPEGLPIDG